MRNLISRKKKVVPNSEYSKIIFSLFGTVNTEFEFSERSLYFIKNHKRMLHISWCRFKTLKCFHLFIVYMLPSEPASVAQLDTPSDWRPGGRRFNPRRGWQHSFVEIDHEIFSTVILSLLLIQEGQLSVSGERMCTILVNCLED